MVLWPTWTEPMCYNYWSHAARVHTPPGSCLLHLRWEALSGFCCRDKGSGETLRVQLNLLLQKEQFGAGEHRTLLTVNYTGALSAVSISDFIKEERGLRLHSWARLLLLTCHTAGGCKNPFKNTRFRGNAVQHYCIVGVFFFLSFLSHRFSPMPSLKSLGLVAKSLPRAPQNSPAE